MAKLLIVDGPEKAGKTTLIEKFINYCGVRGISAQRRHWSKPGPTHHSFVYTLPMIEALNNKDVGIEIWDRSWASEYVYPLLMPETRSERRIFWDDPWLAAFSYDRALMTNGARLMLLGPSVDHLRAKRDETDWPIDPALEQRAYDDYAVKTGWMISHNQHTPDHDNYIIEQVFKTITNQQIIPELSAPEFVGPIRPGNKVIIIGEARNEDLPKAWLPFTSRYTIRLARQFGDCGLFYQWSNASHIEANFTFFKDYLEDTTVVACGSVAQQVANRLGVSDILTIPHPAHGFRWGQEVAEAYIGSINDLKIELQKRNLYYEKSK